MSAVLTGLSLATSIAREATDGVPIVKQVLGVASRVVGLAEQIDKNRDDLRGLADRAKRLDATISAIVAERELDPEILRRLEALSAVLNAIEKRFADHIKQGRVRKTLRYIFTVRKDIDRLKGDFDDRLKELELSANIDTNIIARGNSRFIGEFRNIRHCEVTLLRPIERPSGSNGGRAVSCHLATCEGSNKVFVVRSLLSSDLDEYERKRNEYHTRILEHMSLMQNRHPAIACLYGKNVGPRCNRFVVLEAGKIRPLGYALTAGTADIAVLGQMVAKLVDASLHLQKHGVTWNGGFHPGVYVDDNYKPTIGIDDDLYTMTDTPKIRAAYLSSTIATILDKSTTSYHSQGHQLSNPTLPSTAWCTEMLEDLIYAVHSDLRRENMVRRADISSLFPPSHESWTYLRRASQNSGCVVPGWGFLLFRLAAGNGKCDGSIMGAWYRPNQSRERDKVTVYCVEGDVDVVHYRETYIEIPGPVADEARQKLGIPLKGDRDLEDFLFQRSAGAGATSTEYTGWIDGFRMRVPW